MSFIADIFDIRKQEESRAEELSFKLDLDCSFLKERLESDNVKWFLNQIGIEI